MQVADNLLLGLTARQFVRLAVGASLAYEVWDIGSALPAGVRLALTACLVVSFLKNERGAEDEDLPIEAPAIPIMVQSAVRYGFILMRSRCPPMAALGDHAFQPGHQCQPLLGFLEGGCLSDELEVRARPGPSTNSR
jgi:hypothetical protein